MRSVPEPKWFTRELQEEIYPRDFLKKHGQHEESNKLRNAVYSQKRAAKNNIKTKKKKKKEIHPGPPI